MDRVLLGIALTTVVAVGCGGGDTTPGTGGATTTTTTTSSTTTSSSTSSSSTGTGGDGGGGAAPSCPTHEGTVFAVKQLFFGEGNSGEWKKFGFDLDGLTSTGVSKDVCQTNSGGLASIAYPDGDNGIDNSFGKNLLPTILSLYPTWSSDINNSIQTGIFTGLVKVECLPPTGDAPLLLSKLFGGTTLGTTPQFDGKDTWPVEPGLLSDVTDPTSSTITFEKSSVKSDVFDSGKNVTFVITVPVTTTSNTTSIKLTLHSAHLTMNLSPDRKSTTGMVGGVLNTEEFVAELKKVGSLLKLCNTAIFDGLLNQVRQASDIMTDGTQDPAKTCDGISMGLGFEMHEALLGGVGPANNMGSACQ